MKLRLLENTQKVAQNKSLPFLVSNVIELLDIDPDVDESEQDKSALDLDSTRKGKCAVIKTSTRQTIFLPLIGLVKADTLKPNDLVGVQKESYLILDTLPSEYDSRVKAMEVDEKPKDSYQDIGGLDKQIEELVEAIVLPMKQADKFKSMGIKPPKGVLMYGPPGACLTSVTFVSVCAHLKPNMHRHRQDPSSTRVCGPNRSVFSQTSGAFTCSNVHRRRRKVDPRRFRASKGESANNHFH